MDGVTFLVRVLHPLQVREVGFDLGEILRLVVEVTERDLHAAKLALKSRRAGGGVRAGVVAPEGPRTLLHAGRVVQGLGLRVPVPGSPARVHAGFPAARRRVAAHPRGGRLVHVRYAVIHGGEPQQSTMEGYADERICFTKKGTKPLKIKN